MSKCMQGLVVVWLAFCVFEAQAAEGADAAADKIPWGEEANGLVCRLQVQSAYYVGQPIQPRLEIKNVSDKDVHFYRLVEYQDTRYGRLRVLGPEGKPVKQSRFQRYPPQLLHRFGTITLHPSQTQSLPLADLRLCFQKAFAEPGVYTLSYQHFGPSLDQDKPLRAGTWTGTLTAPATRLTIRNLKPEELTIHEWGVFSVYNSMAYANADMRAEWESFPPHFYRQFPKAKLPTFPTVVRKPLVYFHTIRTNLDVRFEVSFTSGAPVVWYPATQEPRQWVGPRATRMNKNTPGLYKKLVWQARLLGPDKQQALEKTKSAHPWNRPAKVTPAEPGSWIDLARQVPEASQLTVISTFSRKGAPRQREHFLYYDGLIPRLEALTCVKAEAGSVTLRNVAKYDLAHVFVVDRRSGFAFAYLPKLAAGAQETIPPRPVDKPDWPAKPEAALVEALKKAGLLDSEATSLARIWRHGFFETPGVTAFCVFPQQEYDRLLPSTVTPRPGAFLRVGMALYPHIEGEPGFASRVQQLIGLLDHEEAATRDFAKEELSQFGPAAFRLLQLALQETKSQRVRDACQALLKNNACLYLPEHPAAEPGAPTGDVF